MTTDLEQRVTELEKDLSLTLAAVRNLAGTPQPAPQKSLGMRAWEITQQILLSVPQVVVSTLPNLIVAWVTFHLFDYVKQDIEERELNTKNATEMRVLLQGVYTVKPDSKEARANVLTLAIFGRYAVAPLVELLDSGAKESIPSQMELAEEGLLEAGLTDAKATCSALSRVLADRALRFDWRTHKKVINVLEGLCCRDAAPALSHYLLLIDSGREKFSKAVSGIQFGNELDDLRAIANKAIEGVSKCESSDARQ